MVDPIATLVSQSSKAFKVALNFQEVLKDLQTCNKESIDKLALVEEKMKRIIVEAKKLRTQ